MKWSGPKKTVLPEEDEVFDPEVANRGGYTKSKLEAFANQLLKEDSRSIDPETGKRRGIGGENPILFPEHEHERRKKEIYAKEGVVDPDIQQGSYFRTHPRGRRVNSPERRAAGAGWYA